MKITFITFHNWDTKRIGGFHKIAEASAKAGNEVVFFSFARPYFIYFKNEERLNRAVLKKLSKGTEYNISDDKSKVKILNCTWPTLRIPMPFYKYFPKWVNRWLNVHSFVPFKKFDDRFLKDTDVFVFESCEAIFIYNKIKRNHPKAIYVYRPSDPLMLDGAEEDVVSMEEYVLKNCNMAFIVNQKGLDLYKSKIADFDRNVKYKILPNGVDTAKFKLSYPIPKALKKGNTALYVGARIPEWQLIIEAAKKLENINFVIVCPEKTPQYVENEHLCNLEVVKGILPSDVPAWVTNCNVVIIPNPKGMYKVKPWGVTAKYYQAMAAKKPVVTFDDIDELCNFGVHVNHSYEDFINCLKAVMESGNSKIEYGFQAKDWNEISSTFIQTINNLFSQNNLK